VSEELVIDLDRQSPAAQALIKDAVAWGKTQPPLQTRQESGAVQRVSPSKHIKLEKAGELDVVHDGRQTMVTTKSIVRRMIRNIIATYPSDGTLPVRAAVPPAKKTRQRRAPPSESQLRGLRAANQRRAEAKREREAEAPTT
jgi:hypothetical protein